MPKITRSTVPGSPDEITGTLDKSEYIDVTALLTSYTTAIVWAGNGDDRVVGGVGKDMLLGEDGNDQLVGNAGNDSLVGGAGNDQMSGGANDDALDGGIGNDTMNGDAGNDSLLGGAGLDLLNGGDGDDTLGGGDEVDSLSGNNGKDFIDGGAGDDRANGGAGDDTIYGGLGADTVDGNLDSDLIYGEAGNDTLLGGDGYDTVDGGDDNDIVMGAAGNDSLSGGSGDDTVEGGLGSDTVDAGAGNDFVKQTVAASAGGFDVLDGGDGSDTLTLAFTTAQWQTAGIQTDIAGLSASFANLGSLGNQNQAYSANTLQFSALHFEKLIVSVDGNYAPTDITLAGSSINENVVAGIIGQLTTTDATTGDTITYTVDDNRFEVLANGNLALKAGIALNYEAASSIALNITATDNSNLSITRAFTVNVANVNEAPTDLVLTAGTVFENAAGATIGTVGTTDPDAGDSFTYSVVGNSNYVFDGNTLKLATGVSLNYEATPSVNLTIRTTDAGGLTFDKPVSFSVSNVNEAPTLVGDGVADHLTVTSGATLSLDLKTKFTDVDAGNGNSLTYTLAPGSTLPTGITLNPNGTFSGTSSTLGTQTITVKATDAGGLSVTDTFTLSVVSSVIDGDNNFLDYRGGSAVNVDALQGNDTVYGSGFNDTIKGGNGTDVIYGGAGNDILTGGNGSDIYWYTEADSGNDTITDFNRGADKIYFSAATTGVSVTVAPTITPGVNTVVSWNNATGHGSITLTGVATVNTSDFVFNA